MHFSNDNHVGLLLLSLCDSKWEWSIAHKAGEGFLFGLIRESKVGSKVGHVHYLAFNK